MFGFSLTKLLFTAAAIIVVWYGFKWFSRLQDQRAEVARQDEKLRRPAAASAKEPPRHPAAGAEEMVRCDACGTFVAQGAARNCGRGDCPFPG